MPLPRGAKEVTSGLAVTRPEHEFAGPLICLPRLLFGPEAGIANFFYLELERRSMLAPLTSLPATCTVSAPR